MDTKKRRATARKTYHPFKGGLPAPGETRATFMANPLDPLGIPDICFTGEWDEAPGSPGDRVGEELFWWYALQLGADIKESIRSIKRSQVKIIDLQIERLRGAK